MTRDIRLALALTFALVLAACGEAPTGGEGALHARRTTAAIEPGVCTNYVNLEAQARLIFAPTGSPTLNSIKEQLFVLDQSVLKGRFERAKAEASELVAITLRAHAAGTLLGSDATVKAFTNAVLCFAGIDLQIETPDNTFFILPSDEPQVVTNVEGVAGVQLPASAVSEPTLLEIQYIPPSDEGPLDTKLDQYPGYLHITKVSEGDTPLSEPVVVGVCATGVIPAEVRERLRLGHGASTGFEIAPPAPADFLSCPNLTAAAPPPASGWARLGELLMPAKAQAFQQEFGGGVGGTVTEFSPFAPVDPVLEFGGGVGGTVTEFSRMGDNMAAVLSDLVPVIGPCTSPIEGAMGSPVRAECRPNIFVRTRLGTPMTGVPVQWNVTLGGGSVAGNTGTCGAFGTNAGTTTGPNGGAGVCWTLGAVGANQVRATPSLGGDAIDGVIFTPASTLFNAIANPPAGLAFSLQPPSTIRAGVGFPAAVTIVDRNGERVYGSSNDVTVRMSAGTFLNGVTQVRVKAVQGVSSFAALPSTTTGSFHLIATSDFLPLAPPASSSPFAVTAGFAWTIVPSAGNAQTAVAGQPVAVNPTVLVSDRWGNPVADAVVSWSRVNAGFTTLLGQSTTDATGHASRSFALVLGANQLRAGLNEGSFATTIFTATGTAP